MEFTVEDAVRLYEKAKNGWQDNYAEAKEDLLFSIGENHWTSRDVQLRGDRPSLVVNLLPQYIHQVCNDIRQNTPCVSVIPVKDADDETAKILKELIRGIEYKSSADSIYEYAGECAVRCGIGFIRVDHDYCNDEDFEQEVLIKRVQNPFSCYIDHNSVEPDGSDAEYAVIISEMSKDEFEALYPGKEPISFGGKSVNKEEDYIKIADFYKLERKQRFKVAYEDGQEEILESIDNVEEEKREPVNKRKVFDKIVSRYKFSGADELEKTIFPAKYIPIVPVYGEEIWVDGERKIMSLIRQSKDSQRRYNHWVSKETELLAMQPIAPFIAVEGTVEDYGDEWNNIQNATVLRYKQKDLEGNPAPPPQRSMPPQVPAGFVNARVGAGEDVQKTLGMYNASLGARSNVVSGVAYNAQKMEGDVATLHFADNLRKSITQVGRIILDMRKKIYDTPRIIQVVSEEEEPKAVGINGMMGEKQQQHYDLTTGDYDIRVSTGTSYTTKRQEAAALMTQIVQSNPAMVNIIGDLMFKNMDVAGADAIAARLKKTLPPQLAGDDSNQDPRLAQASAAIQQLQAQLQACQAELQSKQSEEDIKKAELLLKNKELDIKAQEAALKYGGAGLGDAEKMLMKHQLDEQASEAEFQRELFKTGMSHAASGGNQIDGGGMSNASQYGIQPTI